MSRKTQYYALKGGINTETPALSVPSGQLIDALNYEPVTEGGYRRIDGFERFDGRVLPSDTVYYTLDFTNGANEVFLGEVVFGGTSAAEGRIIDVVLESGTWGGGDAAGYFVFIPIIGVFVDGELINVSIPEAFSSGFSSGFR